MNSGHRREMAAVRSSCHLISSTRMWTETTRCGYRWPKSKDSLKESSLPCRHGHNFV